MIQDVEALRDTLLVFSFGLPRLLAAFTVLPVFGRQVLPGLVRNGVAASLVLFVFPINAAGLPPGGLDPWTGFGILLKEVLIGLLIGYGAAVLFWALESAGFFIDNQRGATMASSVNPMTGSQTSPLGVLFTQAITVIFFVSGGFLLFLGAVYGSYKLWPVFSFFPAMDPAAIPFFFGMLDKVMGLAVLLAAPVIIAMFLAEFGLALVSRFAPQLNVFFLAMPIKSAVALLLLVIYAGTLFGYVGDELKRLPLHFSVLGSFLE